MQSAAVGFVTLVLGSCKVVNKINLFVTEFNVIMHNFTLSSNHGFVDYKSTRFAVTAILY